jgi:hypothetical protein
LADCNGIASDGCETDLTSDPNNCNACGRACLDGLCIESHCRSPQKVGYPTQGSLFASLSPDVLAAWHLPAIPVDGWLWKIGIIVSSSTPGIRANVGVYEDDGSGQPSGLVAMGSFVSGMGVNGTTGNTNEVTLSPPFPMLQGGQPYYVAVVAEASDAGVGLVLPTNPGVSVTWFETNYPFGRLPSTAMLPQMVMLAQPDIYIVIAQ